MTQMLNDKDQSVFRDLFEHAFDALWVVDGKMIIEQVNEAAALLTGYPVKDLIGQPLSLVLPADIAPHHDKYVKDYQTRSRGHTVLGHARRFTIKTRDGEMVPIQLKAFELDEHEGRRRFGAIMSDLREQERLESEQQRMIAQLERLALIDPLTELWNRRAFDDALGREQALVTRGTTEASIVLIDIDYFKAVNDTYGHFVGDEVLRLLAERLTKEFRHEDVIARIGGEEFAVLMTATSPDVAYSVVERVLQRTITAPYEVADGAKIDVAFSAGVAALNANMTEGQTIAEADKALYRAKSNGRARVELWEPTPETAA